MSSDGSRCSCLVSFSPSHFLHLDTQLLICVGCLWFAVCFGWLVPEDFGFNVSFHDGDLCFDPAKPLNKTCHVVEKLWNFIPKTYTLEPYAAQIFFACRTCPFWHSTVDQELLQTFAHIQANHVEISQSTGLYVFVNLPLHNWYVPTNVMKRVMVWMRKRWTVEGLTEGNSTPHVHSALSFRAINNKSG